jgi:hypothetical protein
MIGQEKIARTMMMLVALSSQEGMAQASVRLGVDYDELSRYSKAAADEEFVTLADMPPEQAQGRLAKACLDPEQEKVVREALEDTFVVSFLTARAVR